MSRASLLHRCILSLGTIGGLMVSSSLGAQVQPVVAGAVADSFIGADYGAQPFAGYLGKRMEINLRKTMMNYYSVNSLLAPYRDRANGGGTDGNWGTEFLGKSTWAAVYAWKFSGDAVTKARLDSAANGIIQYQGSDGYWGCASAANRWGGQGWDIWGCKYQLDAMLAYYIETGDTRVRDACVKFGDLMCNTFGPGKPIPNIDNTTGWWGGLPSTSILESMAKLYRYTGYQRYLDFCSYLLTTGSITWVKNLTSDPTKHVSGKCYETLNGYLGLLEMYRLTGNATLLQDCVNMVNDVVKEHNQITGGPTNGDGWGGVPNPATGVEICNSVSWMECNWHLFRFTGQPRYAQNIEQTMYNMLLGGENPRNGNVGSIVAINGVKDWGNGTGNGSAGGCCGPSDLRVIAAFPMYCMVGTVNGNAAVINYMNGTFSVTATKPETRTLTIAMTTSYPENGNVTMAVTASSAGTYPILLRVPQWCASFVAKTQDNQQHAGTAGQFLSIQRAWGTNETIQVTIDMTTRIVNDPDPASTKKAIQRGPQLLSLDGTVTGATLPSGWWGSQVYACQVTQGGAQKTLYMVPYAEAGQGGSAQNVLLPSFTLQAVAVAPMRFADMTPLVAAQALSHRVLSVDGRTLQNGGDGAPAQRASGVRIDQTDNGKTRTNKVKCNVPR